MKEVSAIDFSILKFVSDKGQASMGEICAAFPEIQSIDKRIHILAFSVSASPYLAEDVEMVVLPDGLKNTQGIGIYRLTDAGKIALQDYESENRISRRELWLKNAWIPILVSLITNLAISGTKRLIPLILELLSNTP